MKDKESADSSLQHWPTSGSQPPWPTTTLPLSVSTWTILYTSLPPSIKSACILQNLLESTDFFALMQILIKHLNFRFYVSHELLPPGGKLIIMYPWYLYPWYSSLVSLSKFSTSLASDELYPYSANVSLSCQNWHAFNSHSSLQSCPLQSLCGH